MVNSSKKYWRSLNTWQQQVLFVVALILWSIVTLFMASFIASALFALLNITGWLSSISSNTVTVIYGVVLYGLMFVILLLVPHLALHQKIDLKLLGIQRSISWKDIGLAIAGLVLYFVVAGLVFWFIEAYIPQININQAQDTGVTAPYGSERILVFVLYVVVAPVMEELIFRGYLYGTMRRSGLSAIWSIIIISILFGAAHGQWNVGINVAILSVMMAIGREASGSIWPGILIHMMKNGIAYYVLFVLPYLTGIQ